FRSSVVSHCPGHTPPLPSFPTRRSSDLDQGIPLDFIGIAFVHQIDMPRLYRIGIVAVLCNKKNVAPSIFNLHFPGFRPEVEPVEDRKSTRLNSSHVKISYAVFCFKKQTL